MMYNPLKTIQHNKSALLKIASFFLKLKTMDTSEALPVFQDHKKKNNVKKSKYKATYSA